MKHTVEAKNMGVASGQEVTLVDVEITNGRGAVVSDWWEIHPKRTAPFASTNWGQTDETTHRSIEGQYVLSAILPNGQYELEG